MSDSLQPHGLQHTRPLCPPLSPRIYSDSCPLNQWCHPTISSSVIPFSCLQSFPASGSFPMSQFFASGGQGIGASASASVLSMNIQGWFPLGLTGLISFQSKRLSGVLFSTTIWQIHYPKYSKSRWVVSDSLWSHGLFHGIIQARILEGYFFLQGIFLTQGPNSGLLHCRQILYHLNHQRRPLYLLNCLYPILV